MRESEYDFNEARELLMDAQESLRLAIANLRQYVQMSGDRNAKAYVVDKLVILTSDDHGFLSNDISVDTLLKRVEDDARDAEVEMLLDERDPEGEVL
jgi:hypothetical protein